METVTNLPASSWVQRWSHLVPRGAQVLDVACGSGRHMAWFAARGCRTTGIDQSEQALATARTHGQVLQADIETGAWPLRDDTGQLATFEVVLVTNYLWRPLFPLLLDSLAPGGLLLYETFAHGHGTVGRPSRPDFLLQQGELLQLCQVLQVLAFEDGFLNQPERFVQRIAAIKPRGQPDPLQPPVRYPLSLE